MSIEETITTLCEKVDRIETAIQHDRKIIVKLIHDLNDLNDTMDFLQDDTFTVSDLSLKYKAIPTKRFSEFVNQLKRFEQELNKYHDQLIPGVMGES